MLQNKKVIRLVISDNGEGFDAVKIHKGIGIRNIKSRVAAFHGTTAFISGRPGCVLTAIFPVTAEVLSN